MHPPVLYLDFDGILHPEDVRIVRGRPAVFIENQLSSHPLFEHVPLLEQLLEPFPELRIVLSTSWVQKRSFLYAKAQLSPSLQARVIGATWHSRMKYEQVGGGVLHFDTLSRPWVSRFCEQTYVIGSKKPLSFIVVITTIAVPTAINDIPHFLL